MGSDKVKFEYRDIEGHNQQPYKLKLERLRIR